MAGSGHRRVRASIGRGNGQRSSTEVRFPDRYEQVGLVARGGMASVWEARDRKLDRRVAIKLLAGPFAGDEVAVRRFKREARAAARLSGHPHVVTIYDVGQRPPSEGAPFGRPYIVMEFLGGGTMADAARRAAISDEEALAWLRDGAAALDHAHERGVIHRDVKPANFLLDEQRVLHVGDFGIASLGTEDTLTATGQLIGTAAYLAPERALGQPATAASDRYSLAIAAYELLVGQRPFAGDTAAALARQHIEAIPPPASSIKAGLPKRLDAVLARGMAKRPEDRWPTATAMADALEAALARRSPRAVAPPARLISAGTRRRAGALAGLAAAALIAGVAVGAGGSGGSKPAVAARHTVAHPPRQARQSPNEPRPRRTPHRAPPAPRSPTTPASPAGADSLESRGHALMAGGDYAAAIPVLRQAVSAASTGSLTYAYALYDLGRSLRLAGDPQAAIPILWRRLAIPNQTGVVRTELRLAMQAAGKGASSGGSSPGPKQKQHHPPGHSSSGGAALGLDQGD